MKRLLFVSLLVVLATGCGEESKVSRYAAAPELAAGGAQEESRSQYLAYEHSLSLDTDEAKVRELHEKIQALCRKDQKNLCTVLDASLSTGDSTSAQLKLRAKAPGIQSITEALARDGDVVSQSTHVEDLAKPITDSNRRLEMLRDYQNRLLDLNRKASSDVESLIKISKELAATQSEIETVMGENAHMMQRVETQILNIYIGSVRNSSFWTPIQAAASEFKANLATGISGVITGIAYLVPWLVVFVMLFVIVRALLRRRKKKVA